MSYNFGSIFLRRTTQKSKIHEILYLKYGMMHQKRVFLVYRICTFHFSCAAQEKLIYLQMHDMQVRLLKQNHSDIPNACYSPDFKNSNRFQQPA